MLRLLTSLALLAVPPPAAEVVPLKLSELPDDAGLAALVWQRSPELALERGRVESARAEHQRTLLLPNPSLDLSWNTIPVGPTNPEGLSPLSEVPNYAFTLSAPLELGKRGPRQEAARQAAAAQALEAVGQLRDQTFDLLDRISEIAADELRISALEALRADAARLREIQRARAQKGDASELDADRALLEEEKLASSLGEQREKLAADLRACGQAIGGRCEPFGDARLAEAFLERRPPGSESPEQRPDVAALRAQQASAEASLTLAHRRWLPDPSVRVGYVRDQFVISGNQPNSVMVGLSVPLPFFEHGQADARAAQAQITSASEARALLLARASRELEGLAEQTAATERRRAQLREKTLPLAKALTERLEAAVQRGAAPVQELLLTRRTYGELLLDASELELTAFRLASARRRASGHTPALPDPSLENP